MILNYFRNKNDAHVGTYQMYKLYELLIELCIAQCIQCSLPSLASFQESISGKLFWMGVCNLHFQNHQSHMAKEMVGSTYTLAKVLLARNCEIEETCESGFAAFDTFGALDGFHGFDGTDSFDGFAGFDGLIGFGVA